MLTLQTPVGNNFIKDWPGQNRVNCDRIDAYAGPCLTSHPIQTYVPSLTASTTNPVLGTGNTLVGLYYLIFDQVFTWGEFRFGTGASVGSGIYAISLPFRAQTTVGQGPSSGFTSPPSVGNAIAFDESSDAGRQPMLTTLRNLDQLAFSVRMGTGGISRGASHNIPFAWTGAPAPADGIMWSARYKREP